MITGDFAKLRQWSERLREMQSVPDQAARAATPRIRAMVASEFNRQTDPYGAAWRPIKAATFERGTSSALVRSGALMASVSVSAVGHLIRAIVGAAYARFQSARLVLPSDQLPETWSNILRDEAMKAAQRIAEG